MRKTQRERPSQVRDDLPQLVEQVRRFGQLERARLPLPVQFGAGNEHQGEHGEVLRVHRADDTTRFFGVLSREFRSAQPQESR